MNLSVGADISNLTSGLDKGKAKVKDFAQQSASALSQLETKGFKPMVKGADQASFALTNLGRVAQDAPFGFVGIANNLNPLVESFQRLRVESGSNKEALKALTSQLTGAGGIGIALSIATAAISFATIGFSAWTRGLEAAKQKAKEAASAFDEINKEASKEQALILTLVTAIESEVTSRKQKKDALKQLQDVNPEYFAGLKLEGDLVNGLATAYTKYKDSILASVQNKVDSRQLEAVLEKINKANEEQNQNKIFAASNQQRINQLIQAGGISEAASLKTLQEKLTNTDKLKRLELERDEILKRIAERGFTGEIKFDDSKAKEVNLKATIKELKLDPVGLAGLKPITFEGLVKTKAEQIRNEKAEALQKWKDYRVVFPVEIKAFASEGLKEAARNGMELGKEVAGAISSVIGNLDVSEKVKSKIIAALSNLSPEEILKAAKWAETIGQLETQAVGKMIEGLADTLMNGGNGLKDTFKALLGLVGDFLIQLGTAAVKAAFVAQALKALQKNPTLSLVVGFAAIAAGALIKASIPKFATGTDFFSRGGTALVGDRGPELLTLPKGSKITPNDKIGQLSGGGILVMVTGEFRQRGRDMVATVVSAQQANSRIF